MCKHFIFFACLSICLFFVTCDVAVEQDCEWLGLKGKCVPPRRCLTTLDTRGDKPPACPNNGVQATICCTDCELVNDTSNFIMSPSSGVFWKDGRRARDACLQYLKDVPNKCSQEGYYTGLSRSLNEEKKCHVFSIWGIGGAPPQGIEISENPYEALLGFGNDLETAVWLKTGAILSEKFILTSAHGNTKTQGNLALKFAALGVKNRKGDKKDWQIHTVKKIYEHPELNNKYNDIALIELQDTITFNTKVLPACLPEPSEEFEIKNAKFSSWKDKTTDVNSFLDTSNIVNVEKLTAAECDAKMAESEASILASYKILLPEKVKDDSQLCYGNKDTCLNISGGPLTVTTQYSRCMNTVIGIHAFGDSCGPAVFTKVEHFTPWIESIVWP